MTLEIVIDVPGGVDEHNVRVVTENARALGFTHFRFEGSEQP